MAKHTSLKRTTVIYSLQFIAITASSFLLAGVAFGNRPWPLTLPSNPAPVQCRTAAQLENDLSRDQLAQLRQLEDQPNKSELQNLLGEPYCQIGSVEQGGEKVTGEAYPLAFDPQTWLVVLYQEDTYVGYQFEFR